MMERHGVGLPPEEYEKKLTKGGKKALFVANSGEATAIIVVSYRPNPKAQKWLAALARKELYDLAGVRVVCTFVDDIYILTKLD